MVAFVRDGTELRVLDLATKAERSLATGHLTRSDRGIAWSPDSKWIAYVWPDQRAFRERVRGPRGWRRQPAGEHHAQRHREQHLVEPDGTYIIFNTNQRTEESRTVQVDLILRAPRFREDRFRDLFREDPTRTPAEQRRTEAPASPPQETTPPREQPPAQAPTPAAGRDTAAATPPARREPPKPVDIVFDGIRRRLNTLNVGVDVGTQTISPDGRLLLLTASAGGQTNLYTYSLDELAREPAVARQLTSTPGPKSDAQFTPDSREVFYLEQGRITVMPIETRQARTISVTAEMDVDFAVEKMEVFRQAWTYMRDGFYDDKFHGVNWNAVREQYAPRIAGAQTPDEMRRLLNLMVGELNASHMGVSGGGGRGGRREPASGSWQVGPAVRSA